MTDDIENTSFQLASERIDHILSHQDGFTAERLMQGYDVSGFAREAYVAALIGRLMLEMGRRKTT